MRIAVAGTHGAGKSTLAEDFVGRHPEYAHEPEPYVWLEGLPEEPAADDFFEQLQLSVERLKTYRPGDRVIAERSPLDFVAYLAALVELRRGGRPADVLASAIEIAGDGLAHLDLLVVLPLEPRLAAVAEDEDPELREAMNDCLLDLVATDRFGLLGGLTVVEIEGARRDRLDALMRAVG